MKTILLLSFFLLVGITYSQSKKEQIEQLNNRVDSLKSVISAERVDNSKKISTLESSKTYLEERYNELENDYNSLVNKVSTLSIDLQTSNAERASKQQTINDLQTQLQSKKDSLDLIKAELEKLKPAPKPVVTNTTNQVTQTGSIKSVKIGTQIWMAENLYVSTFRNGDPIPEAKTNEEWKQAGINKQPAWCYYENDLKNGAKYGKLYNWYAVNDSRGLAPAGWHIPTDEEWIVIQNTLETDESNKMISESGWNSWYEVLICKKCENWDDQFRKNRICSTCNNTKVNGKITHSGNGSNTSGFSGLPGGERGHDGFFNGVGFMGSWWSGTEGNTSLVYFRCLNSSYMNELMKLWHNKEAGLSVRCVRD
jgi:uncharacterized protein (TIGR02145 family)